MKERSYQNQKKDTIIFMQNEKTNEINVVVVVWGYRRTLNFTFTDEKQKKDIIELFEVKE